MIVAFDLDDTLYPELSYVHSGFRAVSRALGDRFGIPPEASFTRLCDSLARDGRGHTFDDLLRHHGLYSRRRVSELLAIYRHHWPEIAPFPDTLPTLEALADLPLYLVTDGHKLVQQMKVDALGLGRRFRHCILTHRYGRRHAKPSPYVFEQIRRREGCEPGELVYIGDNPHKDFKGIRPLGYPTIRVRTGAHASSEVPPEEDAEVEVARLGDVVAVLRSWQENRCRPHRSSP